MKKILLFATCLLAAAACTSQKEDAARKALEMQRDSLSAVVQQKDQEINDIVSTMNDIEEGFQAINEAENRVTMAQHDEGNSNAERLRNDVRFIQQTMQQNRELINKLRSQLRQSSLRSEQLKRTLETMTQQLEEKDKQLAALQAELQAKNIQIESLSTQVTELTDNVSSLREETAQKTQTITTQDKQLNTAWFVYGTKKELKEQRILEGGKLLQSNFNRDYFTKIDIRVDKEIKLYSRSAKLLTSHPASSYALVQDANKQYTLRILDPQLFWSASKYLVIQVK